MNTFLRIRLCGTWGNSQPNLYPPPCWVFGTSSILQLWISCAFLVCTRTKLKSTCHRPLASVSGWLASWKNRSKCWEICASRSGIGCQCQCSRGLERALVERQIRSWCLSILELKPSRYVALLRDQLGMRTFLTTCPFAPKVKCLSPQISELRLTI